MSGREAADKRVAEIMERLLGNRYKGRPADRTHQKRRDVKRLQVLRQQKHNTENN